MTKLELHILVVAGKLSALIVKNTLIFVTRCDEIVTGALLLSSVLPEAQSGSRACL